MALKPTKDMVIVAVSLDRAPAAAETLAKAHPDWIVARCALGADDPVVRRFDIYPFPATWVMMRNGAAYTSDELMDVSSCLGWAHNVFANAGRQPWTALPQWLNVCRDTIHAKDIYETTTILTANQWQPTSGWLEWYETGTERVVRDGLKLLDMQVQAKSATLLVKLGKLTAVTGGGWGPPAVVNAANEDLAAIRSAKQAMDEALGLRAGMKWAQNPDVAQLLQQAEEGDCVRVPMTPEGEAQQQLLLRFFNELATPAPTSAPDTQPTTMPAYRLFRVKPL